MSELYSLTEPSGPVTEFAERHRPVQPRTVYRLIRSGEVPAIRLGHQLRIPESSSATAVTE